jgi:outer membrane protein OmpA-like peptidoglycan-associated protein
MSDPHDPATGPGSPPAEPTAPAAPETAATPGILRFRLPTNTLLVGLAVVLLAAIVILMVANRRSTQTNHAGDLLRKKAERDVLRASIEAERNRLGLPALSAGGVAEDPTQIAERLGRDATALAGMLNQFDDLLRQRDALTAEKSAALLASEQQLQALTQRLARVQDERDQALVDGSNSDLLRRQLETERQRAADLDRQLRETQANLENYAGRPDPAELERLRTQLDEARRARDFFDDRNRQLEAELAKQRSVPPPPQPRQDLFADDESELLPAAVKLFASLRKLENKTDDELMAAYSRFGNELGATVLRKLSFPTGASDLTPDDLAAVKALAPTLPDQGLILVIGYASETGNVDANRELSSARATKTAEAINAGKTANQRVQAAYLGQTDRFSSRIPERNQICEVWHLLPPATPPPRNP